MMKDSWMITNVFSIALAICGAATVRAENNAVHVDSLARLYAVAAENGQTVRVEPGVYALADYLTEERLEQLRSELPKGEGRPPRWLLRFSGSDNSFDFTGVTLEIDTDLYGKLPYGYMRCIFMDGDNNTLRGLTIRNTGPADQGSNGNMLSVYGNNTLLEDVRLYVRGSSPFGYGDLLGKGGPNLTGLQKQSGMMVAGQNNTLRRCKVFSRAFGHCFYIQTQGHDTKNILLEDCYAEGITRTTDEMLAETAGLAHDLGFRSVYENRDGRFMITPGYTKALTEDGFRTYGGVGTVTLRNCTAINTRAGFEIGGTKTADTRTLLDGCQAFGAERSFLLGSNVRVRDCRGDIAHGPLLYLRENTEGADVELELVAGMPETTVHVLATIAGENHRIRLFTREPQNPVPALPILLGFAMPAHAEMSSPINSAPTSGVKLINELARLSVIISDDAKDVDVESPGPVVRDSKTRKYGGRGNW